MLTDADAHLFIDDATASAGSCPSTYNCFIGGFCTQAAISYPPADYEYTNAYEHDKRDKGNALAAGCNDFRDGVGWEAGLEEELMGTTFGLWKLMCQ